MTGIFGGRFPCFPYAVGTLSCGGESWYIDLSMEENLVFTLHVLTDTTASGNFNSFKEIVFTGKKTADALKIISYGN